MTDTGGASGKAAKLGDEADDGEADGEGAGEIDDGETCETDDGEANCETDDGETDCETDDGNLAGETDGNLDGESACESFKVAVDFDGEAPALEFKNFFISELLY